MTTNTEPEPVTTPEEAIHAIQEILNDPTTNPYIALINISSTLAELRANQ